MTKLPKMPHVHEQHLFDPHSVVGCPACLAAVESARLDGEAIVAAKEALAGCGELFDNYGFADESPCVRDREIVAQMKSARALLTARLEARGR